MAIARFGWVVLWVDPPCPHVVAGLYDIDMVNDFTGGQRGLARCVHTESIGGGPMAAKQHNDTTNPHTERGHGIETRPARKTTELIAYVATVLALAVTAFVVAEAARTRQTRSAPSRP